MVTYNSFIKSNIAPQGAKKIGIFSGDTKVSEVSIGTLANTEETPLFSFGLFSDIHISDTRQGDYPNGANKFRKGLDFCNSYGVDFVTVDGDISVEQLNSEYQQFKDIRNEYSFPIYSNAGNHDMGRVVSFGDSSNSSVVYDNTTWKNYTGQDINFYIPYEKNGKKFYFIFLSCKKWRTDVGAGNTDALYESSDVTGWLTNTLSSCSDGQCFVYVHAPLPERGNFGLSYDARSVLLGTALTKIRELSNTYKNNTIWFHGHTHWGWENQGVEYSATYEETSGNDPYELYIKGAITKEQAQAGKGCNLDANVYPTSNEGRTSGWHVHIPSNCISRFYPTGVDSRDKYRSQFAIVDVYSDHVIIKGLSFDNTDDNSEIKYVPLAQYKLYYEAGAASGGNGDTSGETDSGGSSSGGSSSGDSGSSSEGSSSSSNVVVTYDASGSSIYKAMRGWLELDGNRVDNPVAGVRYDIVAEISKDGTTFYNDLTNFKITNEGTQTAINGARAYCSYTFPSAGTYTLSGRNKEIIDGAEDRIRITYTVTIV